MTRNILEVRGLTIHFHIYQGIIHAVNGVSFSIEESETLGIVGESGCGKSVTMQSILRLIPSPPGEIVAGQALYQGRDLLQLPNKEIRRIAGKEIAIVFQDPSIYLNPVLTIGQQIMETLDIHLGLSRRESQVRAAELLDLVGIPNAKDRLSSYPHQFSGGMSQRAMIAMALACSPRILIADEPTTALDVTIQAQIIRLVKRLRDELGMAMIWITHDLGVIAGLVQRVLVMYAGHIIEESRTRELYANPLHPYTIGLLGCVPRVDAEDRPRLFSIEGLPPVMLEDPIGCPFAPRCDFAIEKCWYKNPPLLEISLDHRAACWVHPETREAYEQ